MDLVHGVLVMDFLKMKFWGRGNSSLRHYGNVDDDLVMSGEGPTNYINHDVSE